MPLHKLAQNCETYTFNLEIDGMPSVEIRPMAQGITRWFAGAMLVALSSWMSYVGLAHGDSADAPDFAELVQQRYVLPFQAGDVETWVQAFATDAIALHNHRPADRGREAIEAFGRLVHQVFDLAEYDVAVTDIRTEGNWAMTVGSFTTRFVSKADGSEPFGRQEGKFVLVWQRNEQGRWEIILDMGNSNQ
jgi:ketosteroid isomerase-like protein